MSTQPINMGYGLSYLPGGSPLFDPEALRQQAGYGALGDSALALLAAGAPSTTPHTSLQGLGGALGAFGAGYQRGINTGMRQAYAASTLARAQRKDATEAELDQLRQRAILEAQTGGLPIPSKAAADQMNGGYSNPLMRAAMQPPSAPAGYPMSPIQRAAMGGGDVPTVEQYQAQNGGTVPAGLNDAINRSVGLSIPAADGNGVGGVMPQPARIESTGYGASGPWPRDDLGHQGPGGVQLVNSSPAMPPKQSQFGPTLPPAMRDYLLAAHPTSYASILAQQARPHILQRGSVMVDSTGKPLATGGPVKPFMRRIVEGDQVYDVMIDPDTGEMTQVSEGGPRFRPGAGGGRGGDLTPTQQKENDQIDMARQTLIESGLDYEGVKKATTKTTATGRENPAYNPMVEAMVRRATKKKAGDDPDYESTYRRFMTPGGGSSPGQPAAGGDSMPVPMLSSGRGVDATKLKHNQIYELPGGRRARYDSMRKEFTEVE